MIRALDTRLSRLERADEPANAVARIVFGNAEPPPGNGPIIRISWGDGTVPLPRWLTTDSTFSREEFDAVCDEVEHRFGAATQVAERNPKVAEFSDAELAAIAFGGDP